MPLPKCTTKIEEASVTDIIDHLAKAIQQWSAGAVLVRLVRCRVCKGARMIDDGGTGPIDCHACGGTGLATERDE